MRHYFATILGTVLCLLCLCSLACGGRENAAKEKQGARTRQAEKTTRESGPREKITLDLGNSVTMELVLAPAGKFLMGSPKTEIGRKPNEGPQRTVTIHKPFYMAATEVTQAQWRAVMGTEPWKAMRYSKDGDDNAASYVNWGDVTAFCKAISNKTGKSVRLPTEAEWEYACRAGATTAYYFGDDVSKLSEYAWYRSNAYLKKDEKFPHPVGQKKPNAWGFYDLHGNVYEWCSEWQPNSRADPGASNPEGTDAGKRRVLRSGSWVVLPQKCRAASRVKIDPAGRASDAGFRVVMPAPADAR